MVDAPAERVAKLYVITHLDWQREGQQTFDEQRALLLDMLAHLVKTMPASDGYNPNALHYLLLGGQTVLLDDVASLRPNLLTSLVIYNAGGRLGIGPWYIRTDGMLTGGESFVRNLLLGRADLHRHGVKGLPVAYMPDAIQVTAQLPQILRNFNIQTAFVSIPEPVMDLPFMWEGPDGSAVLVVNYAIRDDARQSLQLQREGQPDGPFLWMQPANSPAALALALQPDDFDVPLVQVSLEAFVDELRTRLPDAYRPRLRGEMHLQDDTLTSGRYSARIAIKQANIQLEAELLHSAEPLLALSLTHGRVEYPENQRALLDYGWRNLLQNQAWHTVAGAISDEVFDETQIRSRRISDNSQRVITSALKSLAGTPTPKTPQTQPAHDIAETYLVVWNLHGHAVKQVVECRLNLPPGMYPAVLVAPSGEEQSFHWVAETQTIGFLASVQPVGYNTYTLMLSRDRTAAFNQKRTVAGKAIGSASGESLGINNGRVEWSYNGTRIADLIAYYDGGDAGDIWHYHEPQPDVIMRGSIVDVVQVEATPTYEKLIFRNRMRIAPELKDGKERTRGLKVLDITTEATMYHDVPGIHFRTHFSNTANDHRLRAHIRTGIQADAVYTDAAYALIKRPVAASGVQAMRRFVSVNNGSQGVAVFTRGLSAFEPIHEDNQTTLALTMLRAVGWLDKKRGITAEGAQAQGDNRADFMLVPQKALQPARLLQTAQAYLAPLRAIQYDEKPAHTATSYLQLDDDRVVLTAMKPPQEGNGWVIRVLNPTAGDIGVNLLPDGTLSKAARLNMAEEHQEDLTIENNQVNISLEPYQVMTVRLGFA